MVPETFVALLVLLVFTVGSQGRPDGVNRKQRQDSNPCLSSDGCGQEVNAGVKVEAILRFLGVCRDSEPCPLLTRPPASFPGPEKHQLCSGSGCEIQISSKISQENWKRHPRSLRVCTPCNSDLHNILDDYAISNENLWKRWTQSFKKLGIRGESTENHIQSPGRCKEPSTYCHNMSHDVPGSSPDYPNHDTPKGWEGVEKGNLSKRHFCDFYDLQSYMNCLKIAHPTDNHYTINVFNLHPINELTTKTSTEGITSTTTV